MGRKQTGFVTMMALGLLVQPALACDLKTLPLNADAEKVSETFHLGDIPGGDIREADIRALRVCDTLPPTAQMRFTFVKDHLARVAITSREGAGELLKLAEDAFGPAEKRPAVDDPQHNDFHNNWLVGDDTVVLYTSAKNGDVVKEYLQVSSREASAALGEAAAKREENREGKQ